MKSLCVDVFSCICVSMCVCVGLLYVCMCVRRGRANTMSPPRRPGSSRLLATPHSTNMTSNHMASVSDINSQLPAPDARAERPRSGSFSVLSSGVRSSTGIGSDRWFKKRALCAQSASGCQRNQYAHRHGFNIADIISSDPADPPIADQSTALDLSVHSTGDGWKSRPRSATESWVSGRSASATAAAAHYRLRKAPAPAEPAAITTGDSSKTAVESALVPITVINHSQRSIYYYYCSTFVIHVQQLFNCW